MKLPCAPHWPNPQEAFQWVTVEWLLQRSKCQTWLSGLQSYTTLDPHMEKHPLAQHCGGNLDNEGFHQRQVYKFQNHISCSEDQNQEGCSQVSDCHGLSFQVCKSARREGHSIFQWWSVLGPSMLGESCCSSEKGDLEGSHWANTHILVTMLLGLHQSESPDEDVGFCQELEPAHEKMKVVLALWQKIRGTSSLVRDSRRNSSIFQKKNLSVRWGFPFPHLILRRITWYWEQQIFKTNIQHVPPKRSSDKFEGNQMIHMLLNLVGWSENIVNNHGKTIEKSFSHESKDW